METQEAPRTAVQDACLATDRDSRVSVRTPLEIRLVEKLEDGAAAGVAQAKAVPMRLRLRRSPDAR